MKEKIPRRSSHCSHGGESLSPGSEYISLLITTETGWERFDYCLSCWEKEPNKSRGQFWRGQIPLKREKKQTPDEKALTVFRTIEDPKLLSVLALYLLRRDQIIKRGEEYYEIPESGEVIHVPKITLSPEEGREVGEQLVKLLDEPSQ